jgi:hypothetical protein
MTDCVARDIKEVEGSVAKIVVGVEAAYLKGIREGKFLEVVVTVDY